ncbi:MAG: amidohydrolase [Steroidobacteraceae bacterium]
MYRSFRTVLGAVVLAAAAPTAMADDKPVTLFFDAHIFTAEYSHPYADALAIRGDAIVAVGSLAEVERAAGAGARRVDLKGKFLMPGMIDAHAHPIEGGLTLTRASYPDAGDSVPALVQFIGEQLDKKASLVGDVLVVYDLDLGFWTHAAEIDAALSVGRFAKQRIVLFGSDGHTAWANRATRTRAGITATYLRSLPPDQQHYYGFDSAFNPNGFVVDTGTFKVQKSLPTPSPASMLAAGEAAVCYMNSQGITGWLDAAKSDSIGSVTPATPTDVCILPVYRTLAERGELTAHVVAYPVIMPDAGLGQIDVVEAQRAKFADIPNFSIPGLKVFADGVVEIPSQTAALTKPYRNTGRSTSLLFTPAKMNALVTEADRRGLIVHVHAIGDLAVKASLDAFAAARTANPGGNLPHTMTHAQFVDREDIPRFAELHVIAALQLLWAIDDQSTNEQVKPYIDPAIYEMMYPARSLLDAQAKIAGASDWPVSSANPFAAIYQAETRKGAQGVLSPAERMPREAMLYAYTRTSAEVLNQLDRLGTLAPGKQADLVAVDRDVLAVSAEELKDAKVLWTMLGGKVIYGTGP